MGNLLTPSGNVCIRQRVKSYAGILFGLVWAFTGLAQNAQPGALRVRVVDQDWDVPLAGATVQVMEAEQKHTSGEDGNVLFDTLQGGSYTLVVSAPGFERKVLGQVVVIPGEAKSEEVRLGGAFTDMEEFVVKDIDFMTGGGEIAQLEIRSHNNAIIDNIGSDMMSKAGASTAAAALKMVAGATIQEGKYAVIRGLGDRYTSTSINGIRMPNADRDKRAVSMDQIPSAMIESVQVSKTFLPDQQGDATGGINIMTKGVPDKLVLQASVSTEYDSNATGNDRFKSYLGGGNDFGGMRGLTKLDFWDKDTGKYPRGGEEEKNQCSERTSAKKQFSSEIQTKAPPPNSGFKFAVGDLAEVDDWKFGGLLLGSYSQKYKYREGIQNTLDKSGGVKKYKIDPLEKQTVETSQDEQLWSAGLTLGAKNDNNNIRFTTLYTHQSKDTVEFRQNKEGTNTMVTTDNVQVGTIPGRPPKPILYPMKQHTERDITRPYSAILQYTENANGIVQLAGEHTFSSLKDSVLDWSGSYNMAESIEPDRRQIGGDYTRVDKYESINTATYPQAPVWSTPVTTMSTNNMSSSGQRRWQDTREDDIQWQLNYKQPYEVAEGWAGWFKTGVFDDHVERTYRNRIYVTGASIMPARNDTDFSSFSEALDHLPLGSISPESTEYNGQQDISAWYVMGRVPLPEWIDLVGGARVENTSLSTKVFPSAGNPNFWMYQEVTDKLRAQYPNAFPPESLGLISRTTAKPGDGDVSINQTDVLPAGAVNLKPIEEISLRLAYAETIARPMFKEITPVKYMDYDASRVFLGNPDLSMSTLKNYDARLEWRPDKKTPDLVAGSVFYKTIKDPIQYSVRSTITPDVDYIYPENYGDAEIKGFELESRKSLGFLSHSLESLSLGGNLTMQESEVKYREDIRKQLVAVGIKNDTRPMDGQSAVLANVNIVYDNDLTGVNMGLFYNWRGETYAAGDTASPGEYFPAIVENPIGTLDFVIGYKFRYGESRYSPIWRVGLEFKNLLDPTIETVYRTPYEDFKRTSYTMGRIYGLSLGCSW